MRGLWFWAVETLVGVAVIVGAATAIFGLAAGMVSLTSYIDCRSFGSVTGIETRWYFNCYAKVNGKWVPKEHVFGTAIENRIKTK